MSGGDEPDDDCVRYRQKAASARKEEELRPYNPCVFVRRWSGEVTVRFEAR